MIRCDFDNLELMIVTRKCCLFEAEFEEEFNKRKPQIYMPTAVRINFE